MCRWLAYSGPSLPLSSLVTCPDHSLIDQSLHALENVETTNGDGFGVGWFGEGRTPGVYRDTHPAWNNANLRQLTAHIRSPLFFAHVRATTGTPVQLTNCHPFLFENWLFQHNGSIPEFRKIKRQLMFDVDAELFPYIEGSTDSEVFFYLALTFGLRDDPPGALQKTVGHVERVRQQHEIEPPLFFTAAISDGRTLYGVRYSSHNESRTLYHSRGKEALQEVHDSYGLLPRDGVTVVSEPLDHLVDSWVSVPESSMVTVSGGDVAITRFEAA